MPTNLLKNLAFSCVVFVLFTFLVMGGPELYLRYTIPESSGESIFEWTLDSSRYKVMKKNVKAWGVDLQTNNLGFRDNKNEVAVKKNDEFRIIVLGDSFTISGGVEFEKIFTNLLNERLTNKKLNTNLINLAVGGYNIVQHQAVLEEVGLGLDPNAILVAVFPMNDFNRGRKATQDLNYRRAAFGQDMPRSPSGFRALYVYRAYLWRIEIKLKALFATMKKPADKKDESGWPDNLEALKLISELAHKNGLKFVVALLPHTWNFKEQRRKFQRVQDFCEKHQISCLSPLETFIALGVSESNYRLNILDSHPSSKYHKVITDFLTPYLIEMISASKSDKLDLTVAD